MKRLAKFFHISPRQQLIFLYVAVIVKTNNQSIIEGIFTAMKSDNASSPSHYIVCPLREEGQFLAVFETLHIKFNEKICSVMQDQ